MSAVLAVPHHSAACRMADSISSFTGTYYVKLAPKLQPTDPCRQLGGIVVGYAGFHGPPDEAGMVEIGYTVDPSYRRQGFAKAIVTALLERAAAEPAVRTVRATISPTNQASLATIAGFGFVENGEQWDEEDGLELIFERPSR